MIKQIVKNNFEKMVQNLRCGKEYYNRVFLITKQSLYFGIVFRNLASVSNGLTCNFDRVSVSRFKIPIIKGLFLSSLPDLTFL